MIELNKGQKIAEFIFAVLITLLSLTMSGGELLLQQ